jgi:hypothetical protein
VHHIRNGRDSQSWYYKDTYDLNVPFDSKLAVLTPEQPAEWVVLRADCGKANPFQHSKQAVVRPGNVAKRIKLASQQPNPRQDYGVGDMVGSVRDWLLERLDHESAGIGG